MRRAGSYAEVRPQGEAFTPAAAAARAVEARRAPHADAEAPHRAAGALDKVERGDGDAMPGRTLGKASSSGCSGRHVGGLPPVPIPSPTRVLGTWDNAGLYSRRLRFCAPPWPWALAL